MNSKLRATTSFLGAHWRVLLALVAAVAVAAWLAGPAGGTNDGPAAESDTLWTCSMHPQIRQPNFGLCPICNMDLIPLTAGDGGGLREVSISPEASALLDLRVSPVRRAPARADLHLFGRLTYDERRMTSVTARVGGRLDRLYVDFTGARVRKGDHLAEIYSPELLVAQRELIAARRAIQQNPGNDTRRLLLESAREKLRLLEIGEEKIKAIEASDGPDPTVQIDSPHDGVVVDKLVSEGSYVKTGDILLRLADLGSLWLLAEAYESDLPWLRYGQDVAFTVDALPGRTFHGRVAFIDPSLDPTRRVAAVRINVPNPDRALKPGTWARVRVAPRMTADGEVVDSSLAGKWISPMHPEIVKDGPGTCDICGMDLVPAESLGFIETATGDHRNPLLVPESAVLQTGTRAIVYVRLPEEPAPVFEGREVVLGPKVGRSFIIRSGLSEGELVVTRGAFKLDSELQIKGRPSMMNADAGLEERPAGEANTDLQGQWPPVRRTLGRLQTAARDGDHEAMQRQLWAMRHAIRSVRTDSMQPEELALWNEFSRRLLNDLELAGERVSTGPAQAVGIVRRGLEDAGRHLGLPYQPIDPPTPDPELVPLLEEALAAYLPLARALADDKDETSRTAAASFAETIGGLDLPDQPPLAEAARAVAEAADLKLRRAAFQPVSDALITLVRNHAVDRLGDLYVIHCPMAFRNSGADWLSRKPEVLNPYYGDRMLTCGNITDTLSTASRPDEASGNTPGQDQPPHQHDD